MSIDFLERQQKKKNEEKKKNGADIKISPKEEFLKTDAFALKLLFMNMNHG